MPRPLRLITTDAEYWIARSSRAMTTVYDAPHRRTSEKQRGNRYAPEVAFARRNERGPETNLRRIHRRQARRPARADDGLAQQPGDGAARHAPGRILRFDTLFPAKLSEIAILVTARHWTSHYEWYAHKRLALKAAWIRKIIDDIRDAARRISTTQGADDLRRRQIAA